MATGLPVLICRPGERAAALAAAIEAAGFPVANLDAMALEALPEEPAMRQAWLDFDHFHKVVVVSPFAAECLYQALDRYWPQLPLGTAWYAVGAATADTLHERFGARVHLPPAAAGEDTSEALLELASLRSLEGQRVLLVAGEGGREMLSDTLQARGARVTRVALYRRRLRPPPPDLQQRLVRGEYRALVVSSGELLEHLARWCTKATLNQPLIVSSRRLATLADDLGFRTPVVAPGATPAALAGAVAAACDQEDADVDQDDLEKG
ncbi:uroporphyrinogen-III synthase [Billgrantia diversa]|uniref:uroporphyrinogen-III synthase n=1 Tax=Halomonas sp. MCCC 1A13316 TaxID=2733487 RepID=UPI0018A3D424|nr:uroporphyrinogen-III synthase [Halomonas sp. MCCC 1A13316]QOR40517.1 uroporphyrinogen-III synthase [Halomonas sp. MCCC 1A13316]